MAIIDPNTGQPAAGAPLTDQQRAALMAKEIRTLEAAGAWPAFAIPPLSLLMIVGLLQLAKRHPGTKHAHLEQADLLIQDARNFFDEAGAVECVAVIDMGDDPAFDHDLPIVPEISS